MFITKFTNLNSISISIKEHITLLGCNIIRIPLSMQCYHNSIALIENQKRGGGGTFGICLLRTDRQTNKQTNRQIDKQIKGRIYL